MKVLIIDDKIHCSDLLILMLKNSGINNLELVVCNQSKEALKLLIKNEYDLVF